MNSFITLIVVWTAHFLVDFMVGVWSVFKTMAGLDLGIAGLIAAGCGLVGEGSQIFFGPLTDKGYKRQLILLALVLTSASALLVYTDYYMFYFFLFLCTCIGSGAFHPPAVALTGALTEKRKALFIAIFSTGGSLGLALSQIIYSKAHQYFLGDTVVLLTPSAILFVICVILGFWQKEQPPAQIASNKRLGWALIRNYFKNPSLKMLYFTQVCSQTISWSIIFILPDILNSREYDASIAFGGGHFAFIMGGVLMMIPSGLIADRFSPRSYILFASCAGSVLLFTFLSMPFLSEGYLLAVLMLTGSMLGTIQPVAVALGNQLGKANPGLVSAFTMGMVWCVAEMLGPGGVGLLSGLFTEDAPAKATILMALLCLPSLILCAYQLPKSAEQTEPIAE
jgi:FSR family fosmidomycin resistance protein-like MFS transporter